MKKKILGILVCAVLITLSIFPMSSAEERGAALEIEIFGGFKTGIIIRNVGDTDALLVSWNVSLEGGFLKKINVSSLGFVGSLPPHNGMVDLVITLPADQITGFGKVTIIATADSLFTSQIKKEAEGLLLFFFVLILP